MFELAPALDSASPDVDTIGSCYHREAIERYGDYSLEEYFETIAISHPGYDCHREELPKLAIMDRKNTEYLNLYFYFFYFIV